MRWLLASMAILVATAVLGQDPPEAAQPEKQTLSLASAVALALERNPSLAAVREGLPAAESRVKMAQADGRLRSSVNTFLSTGTMANIFPPPETVKPPMYMGQPDRTRFDQNLLFAYPLSTGGRVRARVRAAGAQVQATQQGIEATALDVAYAVRAAYWLTLYRMDLVKVQEENVNEQRERLRVDQAKYDAGKIPLFYVLRDKAELADAEQELTNARRDVDTALLDLRNEIGLDMTAPVELTDKLTYGPQAAERDAEALAQEALTKRPAELALQARTTAAEREVVARRSAYRPQVDAMLMLDAEKVRGESAKGGYTLGVVGSLPLHDGGERGASVREAQAMVRTLEREKRALDLQIGREVHTALLDLGAANQNVRTALEALAAAEEDHRVAKVGYDAGKLINLEAVSALAALTNARTNVAQATYEFNLAVDAVGRAVGTMPPTQ